MRGHVLGSLDLAQQIARIAADAFGGDFHGLNHALRIDDEGAAIGQALVFAHVFKVARDRARGVANHGVFDLADGLGRIGPGLVHEMRVGGDGVNLHAHLLEFGVVVGHVAQLGGAHEGEIGRVEEEHGPLAFDIGFGQLDELAVFVGAGLEGFDFGVEHGHEKSP